MKRKTEKKSPGIIKRVFLHYIFLWPSIRFYYSMWAGYRNKKKAKKEKVIVLK